MNRISPTFLDSFKYYLSIEDDDKGRIARQELIDRLNGVKRPPNDAMQKGIIFEENVHLHLKGKYEPWNEKYDKCVYEVADCVEFGIYQPHVEREINGTIVHGYEDCLKMNRIIDIKTTKNYDIGKFRKRIQHKVYLYCHIETGIFDFTYLVTDFKNVYREDYQWQNSFEDDIKSAIAEFYDYLGNDPEMHEAFKRKNQEQQDASDSNTN